MASIGYVRDDLGPSANDSAMIAALQGEGHTVTEISETASPPTAGTHDLIIISESGAAGSVAAYDTYADPVMVWETAWSALRLSSANASTATGTTDTDLVGHPATTGLPDPLTYLTASSSMYGVASSSLPAGVEIVATHPTTTTHCFAIYADVGATLTSGTAPAKRAAMGLIDSRVGALTADGKALVFAMADYLTGAGAGPNLGSATGGHSWSGTATGATALQGSGSGGHAWSGTATGATALQGSGSGGHAWSGTATGSSSPVGSATGSHSWSGSATGARTSVGSSSGTHAWSGSAAGARPSEGSASGTHAWSGSATGSSPVAGSATGTHSWAGSATGSAPTVGGNGGSATGAHSWAGSAAGVRPRHLGTGSGAHVWSGTSTGARTSKASATGTHQWAGSATASTIRSATGSGTHAWSGSASGIAGQSFHRVSGGRAQIADPAGVVGIAAPVTHAALRDSGANVNLNE